jgi:hypothetical protein
MVLLHFQKKKQNLISRIRITCNVEPGILKDKQNKIFFVFEILANVLLTLINWLLKPNCMLNIVFWCMEKHNMIFILALRHLVVCTKTLFSFFDFFLYF